MGIIKHAILPLLSAAVLTAQSARAGLPLNLTGTTTLSLADVVVKDDYEDQTIIDGVKVPLRLVLMGRQDALDFNLVSNLYYNDWSGFQAELLALNLTHRDFAAVLGDSYVRQRRLTVMNRKIRGVNGHYDLLKVNNVPLLRLRLVGGISDYALETDEKLAHQVYQRSASADEYRKYLGAFTLQMKPAKAMDADIAVVYAMDDENTVDATADAPDAFTNLVFSGSASGTFWQDRLYAVMELAHSTLDTVSTGDAATAAGNAVKAAFDGRVGPVKFRTRFDYVEPTFMTEGNPYLERDRIGGYGQLGYVAKGLFSTDASYETYLTDLADDSSTYDTRTNEVVGRVSTAWKWNPNLNASYSYKDELSSLEDDGTLVDRTTHTVGGGLDLSFKKFRASVGVSQKMILDDSQLYIKAKDSGDTTDYEPVDSTINDVTEQLSFSTSLRWRPNRTWNFIGGVNNIIGTTESRTDSTNTTIINFVYLSVISSFAGGKYRPTLDLIYNNYADEGDSDNDYGLSKAKLSLDYRVTRAQSAKVYYEFEMNTVTGTGDLDYMANGFGLEYTLLF